VSATLGLGRLLFIPLLWLLVTGNRPAAFIAASKSLGVKRVLLGAGLYMLQNVAFIVSAQLTYIASVLAIVATGPLFSAAFSALLLGKAVASLPGVRLVTYINIWTLLGVSSN
jgi:drug/metabolite transporter (DMT)-like permease